MAGRGKVAALLGALALVALAAVGLQGPGRVALRGVSVPPEPKLSYSGPDYQGDGEWERQGTAVTSKGYHRSRGGADHDFARIEGNVRRNAALLAKAKNVAKRVTEDKAKVQAV
ncbi:hypothetical protein T484DRAFT_1971869, partial [Baffinella frigidus]